MEEDIKILEKSISDHEKISGGSYYSIEFTPQYREREIMAIRHLLEEYKKINTIGGNIVCLIL